MALTLIPLGYFEDLSPLGAGGGIFFYFIIIIYFFYIKFLNMQIFDKFWGKIWIFI